MQKSRLFKRFLYVLGMISFGLVMLLTLSNGLKAAETITVTYESSLTGTFTNQIPSGTSATNYDLGIYQGQKHVGWFEDVERTVEHQFGTLNEDKTLYAKWDYITYTFNLHVAGVMDPIVVTGKVNDTEPSLLTKLTNAKPANDLGHKFSDWYLEDTYVTRIRTEADLMSALTKADESNVLNLYGRQVKQSYLAIFNFNGTLKYKWIPYGDLIVAPETVQKEGYTFEGFEGLTSETTMPAETVRYNAIYSPSKVTITFNNDNNVLLKTVEVNYGQIPQFGNDPVSSFAAADVGKYHYVFVGWDSAIEPATGAKTYKAVYKKTPYIYRLTQVIDGVNYLVDVEYGKDLTTLPEPTAPAGYTFAGWSGLPEDNLMPDTSTTPLVITATWTANAHTITFNVDGGTAISNQSVVYDQVINSVVDLPSTTKEGYTFAGWLVGTEPLTYPHTIKGDLALTASWTANTYQVKFNNNGGSGTMSPQSFTYDVAQALTENSFTKEGYSFTGWALTSDGAVEHIDKKSVSNLTSAVNGEVTLYAVWTANTYTVHFNNNGGTGEMTSQSFTYDDAQNLKLNTFTKVGYTFAGWALTALGEVAHTDGKSVSNLTSDVNGEVTLFAVWTANTYTVHFNNNGGAGTMASQSFTYDVEEALTANSFTKEGYSFTGWALTSDGAVEHTDQKSVSNLTSAVNGEVTLYAVWVINEYTITFNSNGGSEVLAITQNFGTAVTEPAAPTKTEHVFDGWYSNQELTQAYTFTTMPAENITLYAKWTINQYTITFNAGEGTLVAPITRDYNTTIDSRPASTRTGYVLDGWSETEGGTVAVEFPYTVTVNKTLYAIWSPAIGVKYIVRYAFENINNAEQFDIDGTHDEEKFGTTGDPATPEIKTMTYFDYKDHDEKTIAADGSTVVVVRYTRKLYDVTFNSAGGSAVALQKVKYQHTANLPTAPTKEGYNFVEWQLGGSVYNFDTQVVQNIEITAIWQAKPVQVTFNLDQGTLANLVVVQTFPFDSYITKPTGTPTKTGHTFKHWSQDGTNEFDFVTTKISSTDPITLTALYTRNEATLTINGNSAASVFVYLNGSDTPKDELEKVYYGDTVELRFAYDSEYYTATLLDDDVNVAGFVGAPYVFDIADSKTITFDTAHKQVTVTFNTDGGSEAPTSQTLNKGATANKPANPTKDHHTFSYWLATGGTAPFDFNTAVEADIELVAVYIVDQHTVTYNSDSGSVKLQSNDTPVASETSVDWNTPVTITPATISGYTFEYLEIVVKVGTPDESTTTITSAQLISGSHNYTIVEDVVIRFYFVEIPVQNYSINFAVELQDMPEGAVPYIIGVFPGLLEEDKVNPENNTINHQWHNFNPNYVLTYQPATDIYIITIQAPVDYQFKFKLMYKLHDEIVEETQGAERVYTVSGDADVEILGVMWKTQYVNFVVNTVPYNTTDVYLRGNMPHETEPAGYYWNNGILMTNNGDGTYSTTLKLPYNYSLQYKFHNGTDYEVYSDPNNRNFIVGTVPVTNDHILDWGNYKTLTLKLNQAPNNTPIDADIYIVGILPDGTNWDTVSSQYKLIKQSDDSYIVNIVMATGTSIEYKFVYSTDGENIVKWESIFGNSNRTYNNIQDSATQVFTDVTWQ